MRFIYILFLFFVSTQVNAQLCVGEEGKITWESWRGLFDDEFSELTADEYFPSRPDLIKTLYKAATPVNYDNYFGARVRGFIKVPEADSVIFNITGNDKSLFYLSTDSTKENLVLMASHPDYTSEAEHDKFPEQTSQTIFLDTGMHYYFELIYSDDGGGDHSKIWWKTTFLNNSDWNVISAAYLNDVGCQTPLCPDRGTPCDDGNASTTDDVEDGHCNCVGIPATNNGCIGERGRVERFIYDSIPGSGLYDLYEDPDYPGMPSTSEVIDLFGIGTSSAFDNLGNLVQGYLTVPVTGLYKFNITGDDNTILFISSDEDPANKQAHQALVTGYTYMTQHDKYLWQSTANLMLEAGKYYYIEVNQKQGGGASHFQVFWQTPYSGAGIWKRIPSFYVYDYDCSIACINEGTPCDDGDPFTNADTYDANCECIGTPCSGPDCDSPLANYVPYEKCGLTDQLDNDPSNNWLSCEVNDNPNPSHDRTHWIQYDLGERYQILTSQIWNYNVKNQVEKGFETVVVDYSEDGNTWTNLDTFNWPLATGTPNYSGFVGPDFSDTYARYVLFTSLDDTLTCRGIGKVAFQAVKCPIQGTPCDDLDSMTINDQYNEFCECKGQNPLTNDCVEMNVNLGDSTLFSYVHSAIQDVSSISTIDEESYVGFVGGKSVILDVGFETQPNANFIAVIDTCEQSSAQAPNQESFNRDVSKRNQEVSKELQVIKIGDTDEYIIRFYIDKPTHVDLYVSDMNGNPLYHLISHDYRNKGFYQKRIRSKKLALGTYNVKLISPIKSEMEKLIVGVEEEPIERVEK